MGEPRNDFTRIAGILMGSNIDRHRNLPRAVQRLRQSPYWTVKKASKIYEGPAVGGEYPPFLNAAVLLETNLTPSQLRSHLRQIETELGRVRGDDKNAPRTIDLDIAFYGDIAIEIEGTKIPDPDLAQYAHVAVPLAEIAPNMVPPGETRPLTQIARSLSGGRLNCIGWLNGIE